MIRALASSCLFVLCDLKLILLNKDMADTRACRGHNERIRRTSKKNKLAQKSCTSLERDVKVLVKLGPVSVETSLKELEEKYASKPEWKVIEEGGVLSVPVEEFRMINLPKPDHSG